MDRCRNIPRDKKGNRVAHRLRNVLDRFNNGATLDQLVANRITYILTNSEATQWRHVPGTLNPADDGSRGLKAAQLQSSHRWFNGPAFLLDPNDQWPSQAVWQKQKDETPRETKISRGVYTI